MSESIDSDRTASHYNHQSSGTDNHTDPESEKPSFFDAVRDESPLHQEILNKAADIGIPPRIINLPAVFSPVCEDGQTYITDVENVIQYHFAGEHEEGQVVPTDEFLSNAKIMESTDRKTSLDQIYNRA
jgi:hypothetical protein